MGLFSLGGVGNSMRYRSAKFRHRARWGGEGRFCDLVAFCNLRHRARPSSARDVARRSACHRARGSRKPSPPPSSGRVCARHNIARANWSRMCAGALHVHLSSLPLYIEGDDVARSTLSALHGAHVRAKRLPFWRSCHIGSRVSNNRTCDMPTKLSALGGSCCKG